MSKIGKVEWICVYVIAGIIDIIQWVLVPTGSDVVLNPIIGGVALGYFQLRGVHLINQPKRIVSLLGSTLLEEFTDSIAPAWIFDVWYIHRTVKQEEAAFKAAQEQEALLQHAAAQTFYYNDGRREPRYSVAGTGNTQTASSGPSNVDGIRRAGTTT